ncbi:MAG TPA: hypothetical protein VG164_09165, partial [Trebonia sp.]|nr:hypothetical protein [Trebonia sp.]
VEAVRSGTLPGARLEEAAARVAALRARLAASAAAAGAAGVAAAGMAAAGVAAAVPADGAGTAEIGLIAARRALRLTGPRPELRDPLVVEVTPLTNMAAGDAHWGLAGWVPAENLRRVAAAPDPVAAAAATLKAAAGRPLVVAVRDAHRSAATRALVMSVLSERPDAVVLEMGLPYWQPPAGTYQSYLATYGASRANTQAAAELLRVQAIPA